MNVSAIGWYMNVPASAPTFAKAAEIPWKVVLISGGKRTAGRTNVETFGPKLMAKLLDWRFKSVRKMAGYNLIIIMESHHELIYEDVLAKIKRPTKE